MSTVQGPLVDGSLGDVCIAAKASVVAFNPLLAQFDANLFGAFGLGSLQGDLTLQFNAALSATFSLGIQLDPRLSLIATLTAMVQVQAQLQAALELGLPSITIQVQASLAAQAAIAAALRLKLGGIQALIEVSLALKLPAVAALANLTASLSAGSFGLYYLEGPCSTVGEDVQTLMQNGVPLGSPIGPNETVYGILLISKAPSAKGALNIFFGTPG